MSQNWMKKYEEGYVNVWIEAGKWLGGKEDKINNIIGSCMRFPVFNGIRQSESGREKRRWRIQFGRPVEGNGLRGKLVYYSII